MKKTKAEEDESGGENEEEEDGGKGRKIARPRVMGSGRRGSWQRHQRPSVGELGHYDLHLVTPAQLRAQ